MAKDELKLRGIPYDYIDLADIGKTAAEVTGRKVKTVPQIYIEGQYVGGWDELQNFMNKTAVESSEDDECRACEG